MAYLTLSGREDALKAWFDKMDFSIVGVEKIPINDAYGRVLANSIWSKKALPFYYASSVDGIAVVAKKTEFATESRPVTLEKDKDFVWVNTGQPLPMEFDSVVMVEDIEWVGETGVRIRKPISPGSNVRKMGEDVGIGEMLLPAYCVMDASAVSLLAASGIKEVEVIRRPVVSFIPTGDEIVEVGKEIRDGQNYESNSFMLKGLVQTWGGDFVRYKMIVPDSIEMISKAVEESVECSDIVVICAGSSAGKKDFTARVIDRMGELIVHGIRMKPSKPTLLGIVGGKPVMGLPGYPFAAQMASELFLKPLIYTFLHKRLPEEYEISALVVKRMVFSGGMEEWLRVSVGKVDDNWVAFPLQRGSSALSPSVKMDGFIRIPEDVIELRPFDRVNVILKKSRSEAQKSLLCVGSHDILLDLLDSMLREKYPGYRMVLSSVGSLGGIFSLKRGGAHIGGVHLLDVDTGEYNVSYVRRYLSDQEPALLDFVYRIQGIMVPKGNPKSIKGIQDLARDDVRFVNRQKGSGTRILLDYKLSEMGIEPSLINGYEDEEYTHLGVATRVATGRADAGLGIWSVANALGLDFIPVGEEKYDLLTLKRFLQLRQLEILIEVIDSQEFRKKVEVIGGYRWARS